MRKVSIFLTLLLLSVPALAQTDTIQGYCNTGGSHAKVQGLNATNFQQGDIPACTVTVYLTGTQTKATIYADGSNTPLANPFTATTATSPNPGYWLFWAATGVGYDVTLSGGIPPNNYIQPVTYVDLKVGGSGGGGSGVTNVSCDPAMGNLLGCAVSNPGTTPAFHWNLNTQLANTIYGNFTGSATTPFFGKYTCTGLFTCNYDSGSNTINFNVPNTSSLSVTTVNPIKVNGGNGPVASGTAQISCPTCNSQALIDMNITPPIPGNYVRLHPTTSAISGSAYCPANNVNPPGYGVYFPFASGLFTGGSCTNTVSGWADDNGNAWPVSYVNPSNVTSVYAVGISNYIPATLEPPYVGQAIAGSASLSCTGPVSVLNNQRNPAQVSIITALTGSTIASSNCSASITIGSFILTSAQTQTLNVPALYLYVYSTDAPGPNQALFNVGNYLSYDPNLKLLTTAKNFPSFIFNTQVSNLTLGGWPTGAGFTAVWDYTSSTTAGVCSGGGAFAAIAMYDTTASHWWCTPIGALGGGGGGGGTWFTEIFTCSGTTGTLSHTPVTLQYITDNGLMFANGTDYTVSGTTVTFATAVSGGDVCYAGYYY
jgi:hypothetical protein